MRPLKDWVLLELESSSGTSIQLPDTFQPEHNEAAAFIVKKIGPDVHQPCDYALGDTILIVGMPLIAKYKTNKYVVAKDVDIAFVVEQHDKV